MAKTSTASVMEVPTQFKTSQETARAFLGSQSQIAPNMNRKAQN